MTQRALFLSPHLDDVAFSCGGTVARMSDAGWRTVIATCFTRSVLPATGFALACQLDKGLPAHVDYMALRRDEDRAAGAILGCAEVLHVDLPEAPHRGYAHAAALFGPYADEDPVAATLDSALRALLRDVAPHVVFAPQGLGGHVDHRRVVDAVAAVGVSDVVRYRDTPYAMRAGDAAFSPDAVTIDIAASLARKIAAALAYESQIGFQFGGAFAAERALRDFAAREAGHKGGVAERVLGPVPATVRQDRAA